MAIDAGAANLERAVLENAPGCWTVTAACQHWLEHSSVSWLSYASAVIAVLVVVPTSLFSRSMTANGVSELDGEDGGGSCDASLTRRQKAPTNRDASIFST